jgi:RNA polymerase sigma-70 factor (ECF subfamily)
MNGSSSAAPALASPDRAQESHALPASVVPPFDTVYHDYFDFVWAGARRLGVSTAALDDVVQEIFMIIHAKLHTVRQPESLRSWIYGVVRRTVSDHHRAQRTRDASTGAYALVTELQNYAPRTPSDIKEQTEQATLLFNVLAEIDWPKREVFMLVELEEMTVPEVAEALEIPLNTAYSRLRVARLEFEEILARRASRREMGA